MRFSWAVVVAVAAVSVSGFAQQKGKNEFKVKSSRPEKEYKNNSGMKMTKGPTTAASTNAKDLASIEREGKKSPASRSAQKVPALKGVKEERNPPINIGHAGGAAKGGGAARHSDPYKGRLKQKGSGRGQR